MFTRRSVSLSGAVVLLGLLWYPCACWAQVARPPDVRPPAQAGLQSKKRGLTPIKRLELALQKGQEPDVLLPVVMHTVERGLLGSRRSGASELDRIFDQVLQRHPEVDRQLLQQLITDYKALPVSVRTRGLPAPLANLDPARPLEPAVIQSVSRMVVESRSRLPFRIATPVGKQQTLKDSIVAGGVIANLPPELADAIVRMRPHIVRIEPPTTTGYEAGQKLTLIGWGFSPNKTDNTIRLFKTLVGGSQGELTTMHPSVCSTEVIEFNLPSRMEPGQYAVQVSVKKDSGVVDTNRVEFSIKSPPPPAPVIDSIAPSQYPGRKAIITGRNFQKTSNPMLGVWFLPMDEQPLVNYVMFEGEKAAFTLGNVLSDTQMEITIPNTLLPGNYQVVTAVGGQVSNRLVYPVRAYRYQVNFLKLRCVDESDPERWGSDEVVTTWVIARDTEAWAKNTGEYGDMDDGDERNYAPGDRVVFLPGAGPGEVKMVLAIGTSLYEWDAGDVKAANQVIGFVADLATRLLNYFGMKSIGEIVQALKGVVQKLISWLGGDPDHLGTRYIAWTALDLLQATNNPQRRFTGTLQFRNNDDTGSYDVIYEVIRVE